MSDPFVGEIRPFPITFVPYGWIPCDGRTLTIVQYEALFAVIGNVYGGNGTTNFMVPNLMNRDSATTTVGYAPVCMGQYPQSGYLNYPIGEETGTETVTLTSAQIPQHTHQVNFALGSSVNAPTSTSYLARTQKQMNFGAALSQVNTVMANDMIGSAGAAPVGGHANMQPYLSMRFGIAYIGVFPVRP